MSLFNSILEKLGIRSAAEVEVPNVNRSAPASGIAAIDVVKKLEGLAASSAEKLNWKVSIVDLLKLLGLDSSLTARKELATELGCPAQAMGDSAQMNIWLHKTVLQKLVYQLIGLVLLCQKSRLVQLFHRRKNSIVLSIRAIQFFYLFKQ